MAGSTRSRWWVAAAAAALSTAPVTLPSLSSAVLQQHEMEGFKPLPRAGAERSGASWVAGRDPVPLLPFDNVVGDVVAVALDAVVDRGADAGLFAPLQVDVEPGVGADIVGGHKQG
eukprot:CAMPEP_0117658594 /NCGR_PEP_ID=MMETSP0804-20121206/5945_1 /TAXON_ID=1074897 /ORGANISM="Tetraselmis astigmatica, Strain CCMP880" /LENGTH=115 /DNA_ID=CAMNT_0005465121 /DNA_START=105 /DNA_END=451 /DNA_ORIENTATION=+